MTMSAFALIFAGVLLNAGAQLALKASVSDVGVIHPGLPGSGEVALKLLAEPWLWVGLVSYVVSLLVWIAALSRVEVSIAYPMLSIGYVVNAIAAWMLFGEALSAAKLGGIGVIIVGVYILARA
jgi:multidrug transporter EmrE-like cation transporter